MQDLMNRLQAATDLTQQLMVRLLLGGQGNSTFST